MPNLTKAFKLLGVLEHIDDETMEDLQALADAIDVLEGRPKRGAQKVMQLQLKELWKDQWLANRREIIEESLKKMGMG